MPEIGFVVLAAMITVYVLLDGYDLGAGAIAPFVARGRAGRGAVMRAIGPYWNGNEVWLIAAGGVLFAFFPKAYASAFSGFYLPFMVVLWLLMFRGIALEVREHLPGQLWHGFWDAAFTCASALLIFVFGISIGNLVRGLPLDARGYFFGTFSYLFNPYALTVGAFAVAALAAHGAAFLGWRGDDDVRAAARRLAPRLWWAVAFLYACVSLGTFLVHPAVWERPWLVVAVPLVTVPALVFQQVCNLRGSARAAFLASCAFVASLLIGVAATIFPFLLPASPARFGLSIYAAGATAPALAGALSWTLLGLSLVVAYTVAVSLRLGRSDR